MSLDVMPQSDVASAPTDSGTTSDSETTTKPLTLCARLFRHSPNHVIISESIKRAV
jgi:hypothetical protein